MINDPQLKRFKRILRLAVLTPLVFASVLGGLMIFEMDQLQTSASWVLKADEALSDANYLERLMVDMETGYRGYLLYKDEAYLTPVRLSSFSIPRVSNHLRKLLSEDPEQLKLLDTILLSYNGLQLNLSKLSENPRRIDRAARKSARVRKTEMDELRRRFDNLISKQVQLKRDRLERFDLEGQLFVAFGGAVLGLLMLVIGLLTRKWIHRSVKAHADRADLVALEHQKLDAVLGSIGDGVLFADSNGNIQFMNEVAERLTKWTKEEASNRPLNEVFKLISQPTHCELIDKDGRRIPIEETSKVIQKGQDRPIQGTVITFRDISERFATSRIVEEKQALLTGLTELSTDSIYVKDREGRTILANPSVTKSTGISEVDILGKTDLEILGPDKGQRIYENDLRIMASGKSETLFEEFIGADGELRVFHSNKAPLRNPKGEIVGLIGISRDVTDLRRWQNRLEASEVKLTKAITELKAVNHTKNAFIANMSHEIRTPLGAILGFVDLLKDPLVSSEERSNYLEIITRNGEQLQAILNDIIDLSKVDSGHLKFEMCDVDLPALVRVLVTTLSVKAAAKNVQLSFELAPGTPEHIVTDPHRLNQILMNIVGNAIKFTSEGSVKIVIDHAPQTNGECDLKIRVIDTGIGISSVQRSRLFQTFSQADVSTTRKYGGSGLGLVLSRKLAHGLGGDLILEKSAPQQGSTFLITLNGIKYAVQAQSYPLANRIQSVDPLAKDALRGIRVLLVEDSPDNQNLLREVLTKKGAEVEIANNGAEGVDRGINGHHDIVLMDISMPVLDGYTATHRLRERDFKKPIIALTAHAMSEVRSKCLSVGYNDHLTKPINPKKLYETILYYTSHDTFDWDHTSSVI